MRGSKTFPLRLRPWLGGALLTSVLLALGGLRVPAFAAEKVPLTLTLTAREEGGGQFVTLLAKLSDPAGQPVGLQTVEFFLLPDFLGNSDRFSGRHPVRIGQARTNSTGTAKLRWQPAFSGPAEIRAQVSGDQQFLGAEADMTITLSGAAPAKPMEPRPLAAVRRPLGMAAWALTAGVWAVLGMTTLLTLRSIRLAGQKGRRLREQEHAAVREAPSAG